MKEDKNIFKKAHCDVYNSPILVSVVNRTLSVENMTAFQEKCLEAMEWLKKQPFPATNINIATRIGSNRIAVNSAMRSLSKQGLAGYIRSDPGQWGVQIWYPRDGKTN
jgi:hypothetical protein